MLDAPITPIAQEIVNVLGALCQELETETEYIFLIMSQVGQHII